MKKRTKRLAAYGAAAVVLVAIAVWALLPRGAEATAPEITMYKSPSCQCCLAWAEHLVDNGFEVEVVETLTLSRFKEEQGVPAALAACHTALVNGYVVEGHVPADVLRRFLAEAPAAAGLAVPGMPVGSPGMEVPGRLPEPYDVLVFDDGGEYDVYASMWQ